MIVSSTIELDANVISDSDNVVEPHFENSNIRITQKIHVRLSVS